MAEKALNTYSIEAYYELESGSETKYEYLNGFIYAMAGGTTLHGLLSSNTVTALNTALRSQKKPCRTYSSDTRISVQKAFSHARFYPDMSVVCGEVETGENDKDSILNPKLIVEVLSESTESYDRGAKFQTYQQISSLSDYILVNQNKYLVEVFSRNEEGLWQIQYYSDLDDIISIPGIGIEISMADVYYDAEITIEASDNT